MKLFLEELKDTATIAAFSLAYFIGSLFYLMALPFIHLYYYLRKIYNYGQYR